MAPKKDAAPALLVDANPYGAFVNVEVSHGALITEPGIEAVPSPTGKAAKSGAAKHQAEQPAAPATPLQPKLVLTLTLPGNHAPVSSTAVEVPKEGTVSFLFKGRVRWEPSLDGLSELINGRAILSVHDATGNTCLATASVDLLEFGLGASNLQYDALQLKPEANVPVTCHKVVSGSLHGVCFFLTHRPAPVTQPEQSSSRPGTATSQRGKTAGKAGDVASYPAESDLPPPEPFSFISPAQASQGVNVLELNVTHITPLPAGLTNFVSAATEGKSGGKVGFTAALSLPGGPQVVLNTGCICTANDTATTDMVVFKPTSCRYPVTQSQTAALLDAVDQGMPLSLEIARYLTSESAADVAWEAYRAMAALPGTAALLQPGTQSTPETDCVQLQPHTLDTAHSALPAYQAPPGKAKTYEEAPALGTCMWAVAGSCLHGVSLKFARPLVPPWSPPPAVSAELPELLQVEPSPPLVDNQEAQVRFARHVSAMLRSLTVIQADESLPRDVSQLRQALAIDGRLQQLQGSLKQLAVSVALEKFHKDLDGRQLDDHEASQVIAQLHAQLANIIQSSAGACVIPTPTQHASEREQDLPALLALANECEAAGSYARAASLHQRRIVLSEKQADSGAQKSQVASVWYDYAAFCLRRGNSSHGRAEQALRRAIKIHPWHTPSLSALAAVLLQQGQTTDALYLKEAATIAHQLVGALQAQQRSAALGWGLLLLACQAQGDQAPVADVAAASAGLQAAENQNIQATSDNESGEASSSLLPGVDAADANGLLAVSELASQLALPHIVMEAVPQAQQELSASSQLPEVQLRLHLASAQAWIWTYEAWQARGTAELDCAATAAAQQHACVEQCLQLCDAAANISSADDVRVGLLRGQIHYSCRAWRRACTVYAHMLLRGCVGWQLRPFVQLAECYQRLGHQEQAHRIYQYACIHVPCATAWVGLATTQPDDGSSDTAVAALSQALTCDPDNSLAWGHLALIAFKQGTLGEAGVYVQNALSCGLEDGELLLKLQSACQAAGMQAQADACQQTASLPGRNGSLSSRL